ALLGIVCFLRQRCALSGRFPCGLAFGSHLVLSISTSSPPAAILRPPAIQCELMSLTFLYGRKNCGSCLCGGDGRKGGRLRAMTLPPAQAFIRVVHMRPMASQRGTPSRHTLPIPG